MGCELGIPRLARLVTSILRDALVSSHLESIVVKSYRSDFFCFFRLHTNRKDSPSHH
jgi:hypothetical protein